MNTRPDRILPREVAHLEARHKRYSLRCGCILERNAQARVTLTACGEHWFAFHPEFRGKACEACKAPATHAPDLGNGGSDVFLCDECYRAAPCECCSCPPKACECPGPMTNYYESGAP